MTQTMNDKNNDTQRKGRPGQRQQERLVRIARRRKRRQILLGSSITFIVIAVGALGFWEYHQISTQQQAAAQKLSNQHATVTAQVHKVNATATEKIAAPTQTVVAKVTATAVVQATATAVSSEVQAALGVPMRMRGHRCSGRYFAAARSISELRVLVR